MVTPADDELIRRAVGNAAAAQRRWAARPGTERGKILLRAAELLRRDNDRIAAIEVADTGKPIQEAESVDVHSGADCLAHFGGLAGMIIGQHIPLGENFAYTRREPLGVCVGIGAWNYPLQIACWKAAPALAAGNAMIFKPSEMTPLTALELARVFQDAGLPDGLFQVVQGESDVGKKLVEHAGVAKVSLTGAVSTGKRVMAAAAETLKQVTMELGGKSPLIVFDDADLENAVSGAMLANFYTQGEICSNGTRVYVQHDLYDRFLARLAERTAKLVIGDPADPATQVGALVSEDHLQRVIGYVSAGLEEGARLVCGGERVERLRPGAFMMPTILADCQDEMRVMREEIFGPVMCLSAFDDEQEVIERANETPYGLSAGVFTRDLSRGHRVIGQIQAGTCWINTYNITPIEMPFGAFKQSGFGRENGWAAIDAYTQIKSVYVETGNVDCPYD